MTGFVRSTALFVALCAATACTNSSAARNPETPTTVSDRAVPDLYGDTPAQARSELTRAGFQVGEIFCTDYPRNPGRVNGQDPPAGVLLRQGESVNVGLSEPCPDRFKVDG